MKSRVLSSGGGKKVVVAVLVAGSALLPVGLFDEVAIVGAATSGPTFGVVQPRDLLPTGSSIERQVPRSVEVSGSLGLEPRNPAALATFARSASTPGSATYGQYLAPGAFRGAFGPTDEMVATATGYLASRGLRPTVSSNGLLVSFQGSVHQVETAFNTSLSLVRLPSGRLARTTTSAVRLPSSLASIVSGVSGLSTVERATSQLRHSGMAPVVPASQGASARLGVSGTMPSALAPKACPEAKLAARGGGPNHLSDPQGLTDQQIASAYGANGLYAVHANGAGQRIALLELEPFVPSNISIFSNCYFGTDLSSNVIVHRVRGGVDPGTVPSGEADMDIENLLGVAPGAKVDVYETGSTGGVVNGYNRIVQDDRDKLISTSWGICEGQTGRGLTAMENTIFEQAAAQGQTVIAASGDNGSNDCVDTPSQLTVDDPASQPFVIGAGGTTMTSSKRPPTEIAWNDGTFGTGGGGISTLWPQTAWQNPAVIPGVDRSRTLAAARALAISRRATHLGAFCGARFAGAGETPCRQVPDVSIQADPGVGGITVFFADWGGWTTAGGTSSAAPLWAALLADAASLPACSGGLGFVAPKLYAIAASPSARALAFNDVTKGTIDQDSNQGLFPATAGYDMATGLGTPIMTAGDGGIGLAALLCGSMTSSVPVVANVSDGYLNAAGALHAEVHGVGFGSATSPAIASVQVGALRLAPQAAPTSTGFVVRSSTMLSIVVSSSQISQLSPGATTGAGDHTVVVSTTTGTSSDATVNAVLHYAPPGPKGYPTPSISGLATSGGAKSGGQAITIFGSGFTGATSVTFGGVPASSFTVLDSTMIAATVPAYSGVTACVPTGSDPVTDVCQVHVTVTGPGGTSPTQKITLPAASETDGCDCEATPGLDEFDYLAAPIVTSVRANDDPLGYAGTGGGSILTVRGTGIGPFAMIGASFGGSVSIGSRASGVLPVDATTALVIAPPQQQTIEPFTMGVQAATLATSPTVDPSGAGYVLSNVGTFSYAGVPTLESLSATVGPASGGTPVTISGKGLDPVDAVDFSGQTVFIGQTAGFVSQTTIQHVSDTQLSLVTPGTIPGPTDLYLCTASGCSNPKAAGTFRFYPEGTATVTKLRTSSGPASGGTTVVIKGNNLGCALSVRFGTVMVAARPVAALTGCGSTMKLKAVAPAGTSGHVVAIQVLTLQGQATGSGYSLVTRDARYTYTR